MNTGKVILTGVKPTGMPHLGNYIGAMRPALELAIEESAKSLLFIADYHSLIATQDPVALKRMTLEVAAAWLACGLDVRRTIFYRQSDIPELFELNWILACLSPKGFLNRAHAYKAKIQENQDLQKPDIDYGVNVGLFTYPILMAADILLFSGTHVPVGEDQLQHVEIARDLAQKFNVHFQEVMTLPAAIVQKQKILPGLDGRKMSKSYGNHIPLFLPPDSLRALIMKIKTDSLPPEVPKDPSTSLIFHIYKEFATPEETMAFEQQYLTGIGWGEAKQLLSAVLERELKAPREKYLNLISHPEEVFKLLRQGQILAREMARPFLEKIKAAIGL